MFELINITKDTKEKSILKDINLKLPKTGFIVIKGENHEKYRNSKKI